MSGGRFVVRVADHFHYMDESETYVHGEFGTWEEAVAAARAIVDASLAEHRGSGMTADALFAQYMRFGEDPYVVPVPDGERFSAREYARERCSALCG